MSHIDQLLAEQCPGGVSSKALGEIATFVRGNGMPKADLVNEGVGAIHYGEIYTRYGAWATETFSFVDSNLAARLVKAEPGDIIITNTSENIEDVGKAVAWLGHEIIVTGGHATVIRHNQDPKYLAYWFTSEQFSIQKRKLASGTKVIDVSAKQLAGVRVPLPPLEVQREIARVLDQFTHLEAELEAELGAELEARRMQYEYYRERLLISTHHEGVQWLSVSEVLREPLANGRSVRDGNGYPVLRLSALRGSVVDIEKSKRGAWDVATGSRFRIEPGDIMMARGNGSKKLLARAKMVVESAEVAFPDTMIRFRPNLSIISQRYFFYVWESRLIRSIVEQKAKASSGVWKVSQNDLSSVVLPVPPIAEQDRIVAILDHFDELANGLEVNLSAELEARRAQYKYYRDRLLTFEEPAA
ncbi:restriction endonuclease subunit S [Curtobacterium flaccumfaciens pv. flaccumfaciens]|uniref:restriction endonuclease subunit S n=1 Tax=Curtobacterium flaccumfaciens TaxID=2035 RepID=UPI001ADCE790|nr:restriction endonuclease subunit S [Curtobacterium flaccumfaciens]MBO9047163.1 restriction endonuclease subunit S [Curtobacterium flaccumfaciens pv. flaccumfaciens]MBO9057806.1 restriction endonuclease subunit S [Curtobacterium flaccumfaciens pv. flaccumfaciens]QTR92025.1 restriction endonuclease subunit S [Curtobacterium flaccumfaciens pv. flaccumfaciens]